jgi:hypothetical protein
VSAFSWFRRPRRASADQLTRAARERRSRWKFPTLRLEELESRLAPAFGSPSLSFDGIGSDGFVNPADPNGDVGGNYFIEGVNQADDAHITIFDKTTGNPVPGFTNIPMTSLTTGLFGGFGDPVIQYDHLANRWLLAELNATAFSAPGVYVFVSQTSDPTGAWTSYNISTPELPDYPKFAVWQDAYYMTTNESNPAVYALNRTKMLAGQALQANDVQRFTAPRLPNLGFQTLTPADLDGPAAPPGAPALFARQRDDEFISPGSANPANDFIEIWQFHVDFATPANSTFGKLLDLPVAEFNQNVTNSPLGQGFGSLPQPGTPFQLDAVREIIMNRLQYRNFGTHETLLADYTTNLDPTSATNHTGIRWVEMRRSGTGAWTVFQEGTVGTIADPLNRFMGSIAMDANGNIALGYAVTSATVNPGLRYVGRTAADPLGTMPQGEFTIIDGTGHNTSDRWGDYFSMNVDSADDTTFWFTGMYGTAADLWQTRIARLSFIVIPVATTRVSLDKDGNLLVADILGDNTLDDITIQCDLANNQYIITDPNNLLGTTIATATGNLTNTITVPFAAIPGAKVIVNTFLGNDKLTLDSSLGKFDRDVVYDADVDPNDKLVLVGGNFTTGTQTYVSGTDGTTVLDGWTVTYKNIESLSLSSPAADWTMFLRSTTQAVLNDDTNPGDGFSLLTGTPAFLTPTSFLAPSNSLTIFGSTVGSERLTVSGIDSLFQANLTLDLRSTLAASTDLIVIDTPIVLAVGHSVSVTARTITTGAGAAIVTSGGGNITFSSWNTLQVGNSMTAGGGTIALGSVNGAINQTAGVLGALNLSLTAATGIGSLAQPLITQVSRLEAGTGTGGVFVNNTGALAIGGLTSTLNGLRVTGAGGDIRLVNVGGITLTTNGDTILGPGAITVLATGAGAGFQITGQTTQTPVRSLAGPITLSTGAGGTLVADAGANVPTAISSGGAPVIISADDLDLRKALDAGSARVTLQQATTAARGITLGTSAAGNLGLSAAELNRVTAGELQIGRSDNTGSIFVTAPVAAPGAATLLSLFTGGAVVDSTPGEQADLTAPNLAIRAVFGIGSTNGIDINTPHLAFRNTGAGAVNLADVAASLSLGGVDGLVDCRTNAGGSVLSAHALVIDNPVTVGANFTFEAQGSTDPGDNLRLSADITASGTGTLALLAGDQFIQAAGAIRNPSGTVVLTADTEGDAVADGVRGSVTQAGGSLTANGAALRGLGVAFAVGVNDVDNLAATATDPAQDVVFADVDDFTITTVDALDGVSTADGNVILTAGGAVTLDRPVGAGGTATRAQLTSGGAILQSGGGTHVSANRIEMTAGGPVGDVGQPVEVDAGTGGLVVDTSAVGGDQSLGEFDVATRVQLLAGTGSVFLAFGRFVLATGNGISDASSVELGDNAVLDLNGEDETIGSLGGSATASVVLGNFTLTAGGNGATTTYSGSIDGTGGKLIKQGAGALTLDGSANFTGPTTVAGGALFADGLLASSAVEVQAGATLGGFGLVDGAVLVKSGGHLAPGHPVGTLTIGRLTLAAGSALDVEIDGPNVGEYGQIATGQPVAFSTTLHITGTYTPLPGGGDQFFLLQNNGGGATAGAFVGQPSGSIVNVNGTGMSLFTNFDIGTTGVPNDIALVSNRLPVVQAGGPYLVAEGATIGLSSAGTSDPDEPNGALTFEWDLNGNGIFGETGPAATMGNETGPSPTFRAVGVDGPSGYTVFLRVTDSAGASVTAVAGVFVTNVAPTAVLGNGGPVGEGGTATVTFTNVADTSEADTTAGFHYAYDFNTDGTFDLGDGTYAGSGTAATVPVPPQFLDGRTGGTTIRGRIIDRDGGFNDYTTVLVVANVAPTATFGSNSPAGELTQSQAVAASFTGAFDPSFDDTTAGFRYSYDFDNNGTFEITDSLAASANIPVRFLDNAGLMTTVRGRIKDKDGGFTDYTTAVVVRNAPPTATLTSNGPVNEGSAATVTFKNATDPSAGDVSAGFRYAYDLDNDGTFEIGDGTYAGSVTGVSQTVPTSRTANGPAVVHVRARVIDQHDAATDYDLDITVKNVAPTATFSATATVSEGAATIATFTNPKDVSLADAMAGFKYSYDFDNDGTFEVVNSITPSQAFTFARPGSHAIKGRITDQDGASTDYVVTVHVADAARVVTGRVTSAVAQQNFNGIVATFTDGNLKSKATDFRATVFWGDGTTSAGTVTGGTGKFTVTGQHVYRIGGNYSVTVVVSEIGGSIAQAITTMKVADARIAATPRTVSAPGGLVRGAVLASFVDTNTKTKTTDYTVTINWGDGTSSLGFLRQIGAAIFEVFASHTYNKAGTFQVQVSIIGAGGSVTRVTSQIISASSPGRRV